jgi:hypothetical protein
MKLEDLRYEVHKRTLAFRAIDGLFNTENFEEAFRVAKEHDIASLISILKSGNLYQLRQWVKDRLIGPMKYQSLRDLKQIARGKGISCWSRMNRDELLAALKLKGFE